MAQKSSAPVVKYVKCKAQFVTFAAVYQASKSTDKFFEANST